MISKEINMKEEKIKKALFMNHNIKFVSLG